MWGDIVAACTYSFVSYMTKNYIAPQDLAWADVIFAWYNYLILPFNVLVLASVITNYKTEVSMSMFYASRYIDYVTTFELIRKQQYQFFHLNVFHHATTPVFIRLGWDDETILRFSIFFIGIAASVYSNNINTFEVVNPGYLQSLSIVQWTQYIVVVVHTIRTSSKLKRFMFGMYTLVFTLLILQYMMIINVNE